MKTAYSDFRRLLRSVPPLLVSLLILSVVGMNLLANKSINTGLDWLALDCGILFSWLTFLSMDILTHCYGPRAASALSFVALAMNLLMAGIFFLASRISGVWGESFVEGSEEIINAALDNTFGGTWFIILGSSVAFLASAVLNNFLNYGIGKLLKRDRGFGGFALLVSKLFFGWTLLQCFTCALTGAVAELLFEIFFSPLGYRMSRRILQTQKEA